MYELNNTCIVKWELLYSRTQVQVTVCRRFCVLREKKEWWNIQLATHFLGDDVVPIHVTTQILVAFFVQLVQVLTCTRSNPSRSERYQYKYDAVLSVDQRVSQPRTSLFFSYRTNVLQIPRHQTRKRNNN